MHVSCYSRVLRQHLSLDVLVPMEMDEDAFPRDHLWPTLYLLHGLSDDHTVWQRWSALERKLWGVPLAVVMPTTQRGFYTDMKYGPRYFTFLADELPEMCEKMFHLSPDPRDRFAAGLSMGGYGAFKLGLLRPNQYAAVAAMSAALDVCFHTDCTFDYDTILPEYPLVFGSHDEARESENDLFAGAKKLIASGAPHPKFFLECGTTDKLYPENKRFRDCFGSALGMEYRECDGAHVWSFWDEHIGDIIEWLPLRQRSLPRQADTARNV